MKNEDLSNFEKNGFIILKNVFDKKYLDKIKSNCYKLFKQDYQTGLLPDKIKWKKSDKKNNLPRSLCNIWKSNRTVASLSLNNRIGKIASFLIQLTLCFSKTVLKKKQVAFSHEITPSYRCCKKHVILLMS